MNTECLLCFILAVLCRMCMNSLGATGQRADKSQRAEAVLFCFGYGLAFGRGIYLSLVAAMQVVAHHHT